MSEAYHVVSTADTVSSSDADRLPDSRLPDSRHLAGLLSKEGQLLLPLVELVEQAQLAIDDLVDVMGRATIEAVLQMSVAQLAGPKQQGRKTDRDVVYYGTQPGRVALRERQLCVNKSRLRKRRPDDARPGEVEVPAYAALQKEARLSWSTRNP